MNSTRATTSNYHHRAHSRSGFDSKQQDNDDDDDEDEEEEAKHPRRQQMMLLSKTSDNNEQITYAICQKKKPPFKTFSQFQTHSFADDTGCSRSKCKSVDFSSHVNPVTTTAFTIINNSINNKHESIDVNDDIALAAPPRCCAISCRQSSADNKQEVNCLSPVSKSHVIRSTNAIKLVPMMLFIALVTSVASYIANDTAEAASLIASSVNISSVFTITTTLAPANLTKFVEEPPLEYNSKRDNDLKQQEQTFNRFILRKLSSSADRLVFENKQLFSVPSILGLFSAPVNQSIEQQPSLDNFLDGNNDTNVSELNSLGLLRQFKLV